MVTTRTKAFIVAAGVAAAAFGTAAPAGADPGGDPCHLGDIAVTLICKLMPIAPGLDHDIDLTQGSGNLNGQPLPEMPEGTPISENEMPTQVCPNGC
ncbi:fibronectin-binding protein [Mycolicibacterium sp.]|uniref:fibronectin-binding protein n=1 Tax=Mycolicibacterium sp. TaxID=2320850 RepID=UPI001A1B3F2B|nr:fibronectin-binding protein [Mycolicibacterium sp.]MBJ7336338.1 fibronectin-binding protein [Mycolicibacterium sp.]